MRRETWNLMGTDVPKVTCFGFLTRDQVLCIDEKAGEDEEVLVKSQITTGGGSAANVAFFLSTLGLRSELISAVGNDQATQLDVKALNTVGVKTSGIYVSDTDATPNVLSLVNREGKRTLYTYLGAARNLTSELLTIDSIVESVALHVTTIHMALFLQLVDKIRLRNSNCLVTYDPGSFVLKSASKDIMQRALAAADVVFLNEIEYLIMMKTLTNTGRNNEQRLENIPPHINQFSYNRLVIKLGKRGAFTSTPNEGVVYHEGFEICGIDSTGAGDAFAAAFLYGHLGQMDPLSTLELANAAGAVNTKSMGSRTQPISLTTLEEFISESRSRN